MSVHINGIGSSNLVANKQTWVHVINYVYYTSRRFFYRYRFSTTHGTRWSWGGDAGFQEQLHILIDGCIVESQSRFRPYRKEYSHTL